MTFTFTICISLPFSSVQEFQMGNYQKCRSRFYCIWFCSRAEDFESWREGRKGPSKSGENFVVGGRSCGRLMSPAQETQSMREIRLLRGRLLCKGGGLTGMLIVAQWLALLATNLKVSGSSLIGAKDIFLLQFFFLILSPKKPCPHFSNRPLKINPFQNLFYPGFYIF